MNSVSRVAAACLLVLAAPAVFAQYPTKPIRLVLQFPPGGTADALARIISVPLAQALGQSVIVDNRPGADGAIAGELVAKANPDGYTVFLGTNSAMSGVPTLRRKPPYDPVRDFEPISMVGRFTFFVYVHPGVPAATLKEFTAYARANPGRVSYGTGNTTSILATAQLSALAKLDMVQVPYKGDAPTMNDLVGGRVQISIASTLPGLALAKDGKLRILATLLARRSPHFPEAPTMAESGFPEYSVVAWAGMYAPARTPPAVTGRLNRDITAILARPDIRELIDRQAFEPQGSTPRELGEFTRAQLAVWREAVRHAGIQPD